MKILVTEISMDKWKSVFTMTLDSTSGSLWEERCKEYQVTDCILEKLENQQVIGWVDGINAFGGNVKRTYMLVPN